MSEYEQWGIPGHIASVQHPTNPYAPGNAHALANAYIDNLRAQREAMYANVPQNYSYEGGDSQPPNQVVQPSVATQLSNAIAYMNEPYTPYDYSDPQQRAYAGTPRYQQWIDRFNMSPREVALGSMSSYPEDIRRGGVFYHSD